MHKKFDHQTIEKKWQQKWKETGAYDVGARDASKEKEYVLVEWPYPSGNLHIGHWFAFAVTDIYVRARRMQGKQVIFPIGFDAFGLPAENAAIKHGKDPKEWTESNVAHMTHQLESMGNAFSWDKTTSSTDPEYYKWTQWMFTKFYESGIAYRGKGIVNWCPGCHTVIANEQVKSDGTCDRSGDMIEKKEMPQWMLRITQFADALIDDLDTLTEWPEYIKEAQRQWIGRSEGAEIDFTIQFKGDPKNNEWRDEAGKPAHVTVFTTRPETLFGATYLVLAPEHPWVAGALQYNRTVLENADAVEAYIAEAKQKDEIERTNADKEKTGVRLEGIMAVNPANGEEVPVFIADYVLAGYGTGAIMAVPAHDERDFAFAQKFDLPVKQVVRKVFGEPLPNPIARVAAAAYVYNPKTDKYLFIYRNDFNEYSRVFGGLEDGESYADAAIRETLEETGYSTKFVRYIGEEIESHFYHPGKKENRALISRSVLLEVTEDEPVTISPEEMEKHTLVWVSQGEIEQKIKGEREVYDYAMFKNGGVYVGSGTVINSGEFDGMPSEEAKKAIVEKVGGRMTNTYRLRDWSIGRQRYWGVPIPIVYDPQGVAHPIPKEHLPWHLPTDVDFTPTGEAPLAKSLELKARVEAIFGKGWTPEVETMDTFVDSSWYYLRYLDAQNTETFSSMEAQDAWMPIDVYFGGSEHTTMHVLYSRFWHKALHALGLVREKEPYKKRVNRGLVLGPDGNKMSKSKGNVIDPDEWVERLGADTVKMFLAFMGPYGEPSNYPWDVGGVAGTRRFLERVYGLDENIKDEETPETARLFSKTVAKVTTDMGQYKFNTAISALMIFINHAEKTGLTRETYQSFLRLLAPFAPHLTEELWEQAGEQGSIHTAPWPEADASLLVSDTVTLSVQIGGKMRGTVTVPLDAPQDVAMAAVAADAALSARIEGEPKRVIYVPNKIINIIL